MPLRFGSFCTILHISAALADNGTILKVNLSILDIMIKPIDTQKAALEELKRCQGIFRQYVELCAGDIPMSVPEAIDAVLGIGHRVVLSRRQSVRSWLRQDR
jgi:hypothetical protein